LIALSIRENYIGLWQKSAYLENLVKKEIEKRYPALRIETGKGVGSKFVTADTAPVGAPDLFVFYGNRLICEIEVTGSDKVIPPTVWFGHHKFRYTKSLKDPDSYGAFFFYGPKHQVRYFATASDIFRHTKGEAIKNIRGLKEKYHIIPAVYLKSERGFWEWLQCRIERII